MTVTTRARVWLGGTMIAMLSITGLGVAASAQPAVAATTFGSCYVRGSGVYVLPDPRCTPGATNPVVTQATIHRTICVSGWTTKVRPPSSYTTRLKIQQMYLYGDRGSTSLYEEDHFIPLELGGSPTSAKNLWPEYGHIPNPKDAVENAAKKAVCGGHMSLVAAQRAMVANWITFGRQLHAIH